MTTDQLEYWKLQETKRANREQEEIKHAQVEETLRHNLTDEQIRANLAELEKYNYDLAKWRAKQENTRSWVDLGSELFYMIFSKLPKDATEGFANWGKGMSGVAKL